MFEILDPNTLAGAAAGAGFGALAKVFDGPFKSIEDLWYIHLQFQMLSMPQIHTIFPAA